MPLTVAVATVLAAPASATTPLPGDPNDGFYAPAPAGEPGAPAPMDPSAEVPPQAPDSAGGTRTTTVWPPTVTRISGADRYATAAAASASAFAAGVPVVYIATGANFPDGLSAGAAASRDKGPVLLVTQDAIPSATASELTRLRPGRIVIQGGAGAVDAGVASQLAAFTTGAVQRNSGADRYETALATSRRAFASASTVFLASGLNFPDALGGAAAAARANGPLLLVPDGPTLPSPVAAEITRLGATKVVMLGGPGVVAPQVERTLHTLVGVVDRYAGSDRFGTAGVAGEVAFASATTAVIATGLDYPDALAGGALAGRKQAPLFLVDGGCVPAYVLTSLQRLGVGSVLILGGTGAVSSSVASLTSCGTPLWLIKTNGWRADYGSGALREDPRLSGDIAAHTFYMDQTGDYGHSEDPDSPWYTERGANGGQTDLAAGQPTPEAWMNAPFHAISLLDPYRNVGGYYRAASGYAGLGTRSSTYLPVNPASVTWPKNWPSAARPTTFTELAYEWPDPATACPPAWQGDPYPVAGLPLISSFGPNVSAITSASATLRRDGVLIPVCVVRETNYVNPEPSVQSLGRSILAYNHNVFTIPQRPLLSGSYTLSVTTNVGSTSSSFVIP